VIIKYEVHYSNSVRALDRAAPASINWACEFRHRGVYIRSNPCTSCTDRHTVHRPRGVQESSRSAAYQIFPYNLASSQSLFDSFDPKPGNGYTQNSLWPSRDISLQACPSGGYERRADRVYGRILIHMSVVLLVSIRSIHP